MNNSIVEKQSKTEIAQKTSWVIYLHFHSCQIRPCNKTIQFFIVNYYYMLLSFIEIVLFISIETSVVFVNSFLCCLAFHRGLGPCDFLKYLLPAFMPDIAFGGRIAAREKTDD